MKFDMSSFAKSVLLVSSVFSTSAQATLIQDDLIAFKVTPRCYEPEDMKPDRIKELKDQGGEMCEPRCYDENYHFQELIDSRKERGADACQYRHS